MIAMSYAEGRWVGLIVLAVLGVALLPFYVRDRNRSRRNRYDDLTVTQRRRPPARKDHPLP